MAMVEPELSSMFSLHTPQQHQSGVQHHMMDWSSHGQDAGGMNSRGMNHNEDIVAYSQGGRVDMYHHPFTLSPQSPFDMSDYHPNEKQEPPHSNSSAGDYEYMTHNQLAQVGSNLGGSHHQGYITPASTFMSQPAATSYNLGNITSVAAAPGGVLEEIDGILRNFDLPQQQHHNLDMDPLFGELIGQQHPQQQVPLYAGGHTGLGPVVQDPYAPLISMEDTQAVEDLAKSLQVEIMSENSLSVSTLESCSMSSENSPFMYGSASQAAMHSGYLETATRGPSTGGWVQQQQQQQQQLQTLKLENGGRMLMKTINQQQQNNNPMAQLGGSYHLDSFNFPQPPRAYGPGHNLGQHNNLGHQDQQQQHHSDSGRLHLPGHLALNNSLPSQGSAVIPATGLQLVHLLLACAEAVAENDLKLAKVILVRLRGHVLPDGNPMQRLAAYFEQALRARLTNDNTSPIFKGLTGDKSIPQAEVLEAFSVFYDCIPIGKFGHLTCNQILLDAVERERVVHVLDLQIWHGMQWPAFLQALALRPGGPPKLRMSALGTNLKELQETGEKLQECARNLDVPFEFNPLLCSELTKFDPSMLNMRRGEVLVVNSFVQFHGLLNKGPDQLTKILKGLRSLNPRVVAFAENDGNHNSPSFLTRFVECLRYYSAVFDAFDASLPPDSPARMKMEQIFAAQKIRNIIACEGPARVDGHETMRYWHKRMEASNFRNISLSSRAVSQANLLLNLYYSNGYTLTTSECGYLALGWHGMPLMGVSAWN